MKSNEPCLCGDPYCFYCGDPDLLDEAEAAEKAEAFGASLDEEEYERI